MPDKYREQTSPLNVQRIGGVTMAENPVSTRPPLARKPHRYKVDEGLDVRFLCHANSTHVLQTLWRGLQRVHKYSLRRLLKFVTHQSIMRRSRKQSSWRWCFYGMGRALNRGGGGRGRAHKHRDSFCMGTADQRHYRIGPHFPYEPVPFTANSNQPTNHTHQRHRRGDWMADYPDTQSPRGSLCVVGPEA